MHAPLKILIIAFLAFFLGAAVLFGIVGGPLAMIFSPFLSVFGLFYFPLAVIAAAVMWKLYTRCMLSVPRRTGFVLISGVLGSLVMHFVGVREQGSSALWAIGYLLGGGVAGVVAAFLVTRWRTHVA